MFNQTQDRGNSPQPEREQEIGAALRAGQCEKALILEVIRIYDEICGTDRATSYGRGWTDHDKPLDDLLSRSSGRMEFRIGCSVKVRSGVDAGRIDRDAKLLITKCTVDVEGLQIPGFRFRFDPNILSDHPDSAHEANQLGTRLSERLTELLISQGRAAPITNPWY